MIPCEEIVIFVKQNTMSARMPGSGDDKKIIAERNRVFAIKGYLGIRLCAKFGAMDNPLRAEILCVTMGVGNIILMRKKNMTHATHLFKFRH
jgi:hypothetical protein